MIGRAGALKPGPAGHRRCRGGCGLDRAGPADPLFHHRNERQRVAVAFQINELREKAYSPRNRKERTQGSPRSLDQRRSSEKKLSQHLTETPSCEGPRQRGCAQRLAAASPRHDQAAARAEICFARKNLTDGVRLDNQNRFKMYKPMLLPVTWRRIISAGKASWQEFPFPCMTM
jgi:hypothetical protein